MINSEFEYVFAVCKYETLKSSPDRTNDRPEAIKS
jgi:hypothetical protein